VRLPSLADRHELEQASAIGAGVIAEVMTPLEINLLAGDLPLPVVTEDETALLNPVVDLTIERDSYRELAQQAIHQLHNVTQQLARLREQHDRLNDQYRCLRAQTIRATVAA
jgi:hypothetical protein